MKRFLLIVQTIAGFLCFSLFLKIDWMFSLCILIFSLIYLFGIVDLNKNPQRMDAHLMVGGAMFFIAMCFMILNDLPNIRFSFAHLLMFVMGFSGFFQTLVFKSRFK